MAISFIGQNTGAAAANPVSGNFGLPAGVQAGDLAIFVWYSRIYTKTVTNAPISGITTWANGAQGSYGAVFVGYRFLTAGDTSSSVWGWASNSVSNGTAGWFTVVFRGCVGVSGNFFESYASAQGATQDPNPASVTPAHTGDAVVCVYGQPDDNNGVFTVPANFTQAANWSTTLGTDGASGAAYRLGQTGGAAEDPGIFDTASAVSSWLTYTFSLCCGVFPQTKVVTGIASAQAMGVPSTPNSSQARAATGIPSAELVGESAWEDENPQGSGSRSFSGVAASDDGQVLLAVTSGESFTRRCYLSTNGGSSWAVTNNASGIHWAGCVVSGNGQVMAAYADYASGTDGRIWGSTNGGASWAEWQPAGAVARVWERMAISANGQYIVATCSGSGVGRAYLSTNGGANWSEIQPDGNAAGSWSGCGISDDGQTIAVVGLAVSTGLRVRVSANGGSSWTAYDPAGYGDQSIYTDFDLQLSGNGQVIMAGCYYNLGSPFYGRVYVSTNAGANWSAAKDPCTCAAWSMYKEAAMAKQGKYLLVCQGATRAWAASRDYGATWTLFTPTGRGVVYSDLGADWSEDGVSLFIAQADDLTGTGSALLSKHYYPPFAFLSGVVLAGISSGQSMGTPTASQAAGVQTLTPAGIASSEAHGSITVVKGGVSRSPAGIASAEVHGTATRAPGAVSRILSGIASGQAMGAATRSATITRAPAGVASAEAHGTPTRAAEGVQRTPTGIASAEAHGSLTIHCADTVSNVGGTFSAEAHGTVTVLKGGVSRSTTGIASAQAMGTAAARATTTRVPSGIASAETHGAATWTIGGAARACTGIVTAEAHGTPTRLPGPVVRSCTGVGSGQATGNPTAHPQRTIVITGIEPGEALGSPTLLPGPVTCNLTGIGSGEAHGMVVCSLFLLPPRALHCTARIVPRLHASGVHRVWVSMPRRRPDLHTSVVERNTP